MTVNYDESNNGGLASYSTKVTQYSRACNFYAILKTIQMKSRLPMVSTFYHKVIHPKSQRLGSFEHFSTTPVKSSKQ